MMWSGIQRKDNMRIKTASSELSSGTSLMEEYPPYFVQSPSERSSSIHPSSRSGWEKIDLELEEKEDEHREKEDEFDYDDDDDVGRRKWRSYVAVVRFVARAVVVFVVAFTFVAVVLWGASRGYEPRVVVQEMVFKDLSIWPGQDRTGVPTEMMSLKSKVKILYGKPATFFGVHVSSTPFIVHYHGLELATGQMVKLYQSKKREEKITTVVIHGDRMPLYGVLLALKRATVGDMIDKHKVKIGLNLTFTIRTRANILGKLVKLKLFTSIVCPVTLDGARLRVPINLTHSCIYQ